MQVVGWHEGALRLLRKRMEAAEADNGALLAFARGHAGAAEAIHRAVLALLPAQTVADVAAIVTEGWPPLLAVDACALAWAGPELAFTADARGVAGCDPRMIARLASRTGLIAAREVGRGHPLFGPAAGAIRAEVLVRMEGSAGAGLLVLGQASGEASSTPAGARLLRFLGQACAAMLERCPAP